MADEPVAAGDGSETAPNPGLSEADLAARCKRELANSVASVGDLRKDQERLLSLYFEKADKSVPLGRSNVVSKDVYEVVEWTTPDLLEVLNGGDIISFRATGPDDEAIIEQVEDAVRQVIWQECDGDRIIGAFVKDGLMQRIGVVLVDWIEPMPGAIEREEGVSPDDMQAMLAAEQQGQLTIVEAEESDADGMDGAQTYAVGIRRKKPGRVFLQSIRPGNFFYTAGAEHLNQSEFDGPPYVGAMIPGVSKSELGRMFPGVDLGELSNAGGGDRMARLDKIIRDDSGVSDDRKRFDLYVEFVRADVDGDGYEELRRVWRVGDRILRHYEVEDNNFAVWTPIAIPGRVAGMSPADAAEDIQAIQTALLRNGIDSARDSSSPMIGVREGKVNLNDLVAIQEGSTRVVRLDADTNPAEAMSVSEQPDSSAAQFGAFETMLRVRERRTGVSSQNQGLDPKMLDGTATGAALLDRRGMQLRAMQLRQAAHGLAAIYRKVFAVMVQQQTEPRQFKLRDNSWQQLQPTSWNPSMKVAVHVGISGAPQPERVALVGNIMGVQERIMMALGPANPIVTPKHIRASAAELARVAGYREPDEFFGEVPEGWQPQPPADPKAGAEQAKAAAAAQDNQARLELQREHNAATIDLKRETAGAELDLKRELAGQEFDLKRELALVGMPTGHGSTASMVHVGGDAG